MKKKRIVKLLKFQDFLGFHRTTGIKAVFVPFQKVHIIPFKGCILVHKLHIT